MINNFSGNEKDLLNPLSVIIITWNSSALIKKTLCALKSQTYPIHEVIIVDNDSRDSFALDSEKSCRNVKVARLNKNIGFAAANNYAIGLVSEKCKWIALVNPDAFPEPAFLESLMDAARRHPEYAFFGSRLMKANEPSYYDGTGDIYHISGLVWRENHGNAADESTLKMKEIFSPCAAAALYRKDVFVEVNGFDEDFFCYMEDMDLGFRLRLLGYRCSYVPESVAHHIGSATTGKHSDFSIYHGHRNLVWTYVKNMPGALFWILLPIHLALNFFSIIYFIFKGQGGIILRAKWDAVRGISKMWRKRRQIQKNRRVSILDIWRSLDRRIVRMRF